MGSMSSQKMRGGERSLASERDTTRRWPSAGHHCDLRLPASRTMRKNGLSLKAQSVGFVMMAE